MNVLKKLYKELRLCWREWRGHMNPEAEKRLQEALAGPAYSWPPWEEHDCLAKKCGSCKFFRETVFDTETTCPACGEDIGVWQGYCLHPKHDDFFGRNQRRSTDWCDDHVLGSSAPASKGPSSPTVSTTADEEASEGKRSPMRENARRDARQ